MRTTLKFAGLAIMAVCLITFAAGSVTAQTDTTKKKRLNGSATVSGMIGGESHDSYVIKARKGQRLSVQITWKKEGDNTATFTISRSDNFFSGEPVKFGQSSYYEDKWNGKVPETGDYYIYVVGHPTAHYKLRVTVY